MGSVLIVDDSAITRRFVQSLLAPDGHTVRTAADGAEALRLVRAEPPDLVLMDVLMPLVDGFEACQAIKQDPRTRFIPVVLVTGLDDTASRVRGIETGADDFISKPGDQTTHGHRGSAVRWVVRSLHKVRPIVRHHHERLDGSGYPDGLVGDETPLLAQIIGVVDVFDALTSDRPCRVALPVAQAAEELRRDVVRGWRRADLVATFLDQIEEGGPSMTGAA